MIQSDKEVTTIPEDKMIDELWHKSQCFKKFWRSYLYMITHPKKCLRLLNFAAKVLISRTVIKRCEQNEDDFLPCESCSLKDNSAKHLIKS